MNCIDCSYSLLKNGHSECTYEEGECIKISLLEAENAELREDLRNKKLAIQNRNSRIEELEEKISVLLSCKNCPENKGGLICQKEYEDKCLTQKIQYIKELKEEVKNNEDLATVAYMQGADNQKKKSEEQLIKAKEILRDLYFIIQSRIYYENNTEITDAMRRAEQCLV